MKNLKIKFISCLGLILFLGSCATEQIDESKKQEEVINNPEEEVIGKTETGYNYSNIYSDKFNYYHNGIKLDNENVINKMLENAVDIYHNEDKIEISMTESERDNVYKKSNILLDDNTLDANKNESNAKVSNGNKVYFVLYSNKKALKFHGHGNKSYGSTKFGAKAFGRFANIGNANRVIVSYSKKIFGGTRSTSYTINKNKTVTMGLESAFSHKIQ